MYFGKCGINTPCEVGKEGKEAGNIMSFSSALHKNGHVRQPLGPCWKAC